MTKTISLTAGIGAILFALLLAFVPGSASAAPAANAFLGGGNALARAISGQSQGLAHATSTSDLLAHLTFASTRGGRPTEVPPTASTTEATTATSQGDEGSTESDGSSNGQTAGGSNGGASGGNGGNGGNAAPGGLVRAGSVVSNANAVNVINTNIVRIGSR